MGRITFVMILVAAMVSPSLGKTYIVEPDGSGDFPTIQQAIDAAVAGDEILLTDGLFKGIGNRNVDFKGKAITVRSQSGSAKDCIIDAEGVPWIPQRCFDFKTNEGPDSIVRDLTVTGGTTDDC